MGANQPDDATGLRRRLDRIRKGTSEMKRLLMAAIAVLASACQPMPSADVTVDTTDVPPAVAVSENATAAECTARGGRMIPQGRMQSLQCVVAYADAGK